MRWHCGAPIGARRKAWQRPLREACPRAGRFRADPSRPRGQGRNHCAEPASTRILPPRRFISEHRRRMVRVRSSASPNRRVPTEFAAWDIHWRSSALCLDSTNRHPGRRFLSSVDPGQTVRDMDVEHHTSHWPLCSESSWSRPSGARASGASYSDWCWLWDSPPRRADRRSSLVAWDWRFSAGTRTDIERTGFRVKLGAL